ncbi:MAG: MBL fold metallo-hydrolase [Clostridia bacterium]|nr:MBL fold metallo-hydrolase [Clostridia bacterium]
MELHFLGRGAAFFPTEGNTAAYIREGERLLLLDCGETVFARLICAGALEGVQEVFVAVSHLHGDHCASLGTLALYCFFRLGTKLKLVLPKGQDAYAQAVFRLLDTFGVGECCYQQVSPHDVAGFQSFTAFDYVETVHDPHMACFSFVFETPKGGVFYSADTNRTMELTAFLKRHEQIDALYMEATDEDYPGNVHLPLDQLAAAVPKELMQKTFLMHFNSHQCMQKARAMGFSIVQPDIA